MMIAPPPKSVLDVPGFNNLKHLTNLSKFVSTIPTNSKVLEIGCAWGGSTWAILDGLPEGSKLYTCDTFQMNTPVLKNRHYQGVMAKHSHNPSVVYAMQLYMKNDQKAVFDYCLSYHPRFFDFHKAVYVEKSLKVLENDNKWDLVYLDGDHSYSTVRSELEYIKDVKYICGDDYHPAHPGVIKAVDEFLLENDFQFQHDEFESGSGFWSMIKND